MDLYFAQHDGQAVTIDDLLRNMEDVSGVDLTQFKLWYSQAGTPIVTVQDDYDAEKQRYSLAISQYTPPTPGHNEKLPLHIPISIGLLDKKGDEIPLSRDPVIHLTEQEQIFVFEDVPCQPVPSLLRHFSAPVKLQYDYKDKDLLFLSQHDQDPFNSWEAGQKYMLRVLLRLVRDHQQHAALQCPSELVTLFRYMLETKTQDDFLLSEKLTLPSESYIGDQMDIIDVDAVHAAREFVSQTLAQQLETQFLKLYKRCQSDDKSQAFDLKMIGRRQLKNTCLYYLGYLPPQIDLIAEQFNKTLGRNMTDAQAALTVLVNTTGTQREASLKTFYDLWHKDALVLDKWFAIQATAHTADAIDRIKALAKHEAFDIKNPNKVYALIGTLGARNATVLHAKSGEGYEYLREVVQELDGLNPQVAARMVEPLTQWRRYDSNRQVLMRAQLEILKKNTKLSPDLYEKVTKALGQS
jgi:aminopeptidase N